MTGRNNLRKIPGTTELLGIVITSDPFYLANSALKEYSNSSTTPSLVLSLADLEFWATLPKDEAIRQFIRIIHDDQLSKGNFTQSLLRLHVATTRHNPILAKAWEHYRFIEDL
jgi:hypothetical protein